MFVHIVNCLGLKNGMANFMQKYIIWKNWLKVRKTFLVIWFVFALFVIGKFITERIHRNNFVKNMTHITWTPKGLPHSVKFDDKYFCEDDGYSEALYVFCGGNNLKERFGRILIDGQQEFVIAETSAETEELVAAYSTLGQNGGELLLDGGRVKLTLFFMDVLEALDKMAGAGLKADAWFFDGFDPAKNAAMWSGEVFKRAAALSKSGTTCATFTVAGHVRRGLTEADFTVEKVPGFGRKRQMLKGEKH